MDFDEIYDTESINSLFDEATNFVRLNTSKFNSDDLLYFYGRYKQALEGPCSTKKPSFFNLQESNKWNRWKSMKDKSKEDCMLEYINKLKLIIPDWLNEDEKSSQSKTGIGQIVSTLTKTDLESIPDEEKTIFDWCKEGKLDAIEKLIRNCSTYDHINLLDENGMALLHWSCDRGYLKITQFLIENGADINIQDQDSQTPLHFAVSCEQCEIVKYLLMHGGDKSIKDKDGNTSEDLCENKQIKLLFNLS